MSLRQVPVERRLEIAHQGARALWAPPDIGRRFWAKVDVTAGFDGCWLWTGARNRDGYGQLRTGGRDASQKPATHVAWFLTHGEWPTLFACHRCDNPPCVNPAHLFLGTDADNVADMDAKGRRAAILTADAVREIRRRRLAGERPTDLGREFGVSTSRICEVCASHSWVTTDA